MSDSRHVILIEKASTEDLKLLEALGQDSSKNSIIVATLKDDRAKTSLPQLSLRAPRYSGHLASLSLRRRALTIEVESGRANDAVCDAAGWLGRVIRHIQVNRFQIHILVI